MKTIMLKLCSVFASIAFVAAVSGASQTCVWLYHQPKAPEALNKYRK